MPEVEGELPTRTVQKEPKNEVSTPHSPLLPACTAHPFSQLEVQEPENEGELPTLKLFLWRADMVTGVVEMDRDSVVTKLACCALHPSGGSQP